ncbi:MAG: hypothetical protein ACR2IH_01585 [Pyrinomonadaceae bacterium]
MDQTIHRNLSTSFVDLRSMIRHLLDLQFTGSIHVELSDYDADIIFTQANKLRAREADHTAGTNKTGNAAFAGILKRARSPYGRITVVSDAPEIPALGDRSILLEDSIMLEARRSISDNRDGFAGHIAPRAVAAAPSSGMHDWDTLLTLTAEILRTVDRSLEKGRLRFAEALANARALVCDEDPTSGSDRVLFEYRAGSVRAGIAVSTQRFMEAVFDSLARIFERLRDEPNYEEVLNLTTRSIRVLMSERRAEYARFGITARLTDLVAE